MASTSFGSVYSSRFALRYSTHAAAGLLVAFLCFSSCSLLILASSPSASSSHSSPSSTSGLASVRVLTDQTFEHDTQAASGATTGDWLVVYHSPRCHHCKKILPVWEELANTLQGSVNLGSIDVSTNSGLSSRFSVSSIPVIILFRHGKMYSYLPDAPRSLEALKEFALGGFEKFKGVPVPKEQSLVDQGKEKMGELLDQGKEKMRELLGDTKKVNTEHPSVLYLVGSAAMLAGMILMSLLCCFCCGGQASQAPSSRKRTYKKMD